MHDPEKVMHCMEDHYFSQIEDRFIVEATPKTLLIKLKVLQNCKQMAENSTQIELAT